MQLAHAGIKGELEKIRLAETSSGNRYERNQKARETILRLKRQQLPSAAELYLSSLRVSMELVWNGHTHHSLVESNCKQLLEQFKEQSTEARDDTKKLIENGRVDEKEILKSFEDSVHLAEQLEQKEFCNKVVNRGKYEVAERYSMCLSLGALGYAHALSRPDTLHPSRLLISLQTHM